MGMLDTRIGVVLTMTFSTFVVVMVYQYLKGIDESYVEAARMETSSIIKVIWYIVMPTIKPAVLALFLFSFTDSYNMLEQPMFFIKDIRKQNLVIFISKVADTGKMFFPAAVIFMIPLIIIYMVVVATVYKGNIIKNLIMDCQSYTKYRPNETTGGIFVSWRRKEELPTGA